jgi:hypothetical protein
MLPGRREDQVNVQDNDVNVMDATFSPTFAQRVMYERAMLALEDPQGEAEANITWTETGS